MKKSLAIVLSVVMLLCMIPFGAFAADEAYTPASGPVDYEQYKVASNDTAYIDELNVDQIAGILLDWADRQIAAAAEDFETFEVSAYGQTIAVEIPEIKGVDDIMQYANYLAQLEGDFASLTGTEEFAALSRANGDINFIFGVFEFMAANSEIFGKIFRWDEEVFDYGKVGEYILSLDTTVEENKKIVDFYNNYLIGNNIQEWFISGVAQEMGYTIPVNADGTRAETFDETISNGIINWFAGLCEKAGILSAEGIATLKAYDLKTADIYAHIKNFVALIQSDNQVKIDTYYNYLLDSVVRPLLKALTGKKAVDVGQVTASFPLGLFKGVYADLAYLEEISGGTVYYNFAPDTTYKLTIANGNVATWTNIEWQDALDINLEPPTATIYTGANCDEVVQTYKPTSENIPVNLYTSELNQQRMGLYLPSGVEFAGTEVPTEYKALMTEANAKALSESFGITIAQAETIISELKISLAKLEKDAEYSAVEAAQMKVVETLVSMGLDQSLVTVEGADITLTYNGYATEDEFICEVVMSDPHITLGGSLASTVQSLVDIDAIAAAAIAKAVENPLITVVVDGLTGGKYDISAIEGLFNYIDTDFVIDDSILDIAGNYDEYNGAIGQINHILVGLVNMLVTDSGEADLNLVDGDNTNLYANLQKIAKKSDEIIGLAKDFLSDDEIKALFGELNVDSLFASSHGLNLDMILSLDFSDVETMIVCGILVVLDLIDDDTPGTLVNDIHNAIEGMETLDAVAVALADYAAAKLLPEINVALGTAFEWKPTEVKTVTDGKGEDILLDKIVALAYDAAIWAVDVKLNEVINGFIGTVNAEAGTDIAQVSFKLGVPEGDTWEKTLANLVERFYTLADGIIIACDNDYTDTIDRISAVFNAILPTQAMLSNCGSENFTVDGNIVKGYLFGDALEGNFNGFLGMFEVKEDAIAGGVSVPKALINACQHIVDSIFPGTVVSAKYPDAVDVQETFTSADSDQTIAAGNMVSINTRKADLVPAILNLVRESGLLPYFAQCEAHNLVATEGKAATCTEAGYEAGEECTLCGYVIPGKEIPVNAENHTDIKAVAAVAATCTTDGMTAGKKCFACGTVTEGCEVIKAAHTNVKDVAAKAATCTEAGYNAGKKCETCGTVISGLEAIPAKGHSYGEWIITKAATCTEEGSQTRKCACGAAETQAIAVTAHTDENADNECDVCGDEINNDFFAKLKAFFQKIINWIKDLFS